MVLAVVSCTLSGSCMDGPSWIMKCKFFVDYMNDVRSRTKSYAVKTQRWRRRRRLPICMYVDGHYCTSCVYRVGVEEVVTMRMAIGTVWV